jgi:hypothetical protein
MHRNRKRQRPLCGKLKCAIAGSGLNPLSPPASGSGDRSQANVANLKSDLHWSLWRPANDGA